MSEGMTGIKEGAKSFLSLLRLHERLTELFLVHQEALLLLDIDLALSRLRQFKAELQEHMRVEEELLLPVYSRAGRIPGGPIEFYTGEHKRMLEFLARFDEKLAQLQITRADLYRKIIELFDEEATFKHLMQHHDLREQNILYPTLDRITSETEREELLRHC